MRVSRWQEAEKSVRERCVCSIHITARESLTRRRRRRRRREATSAGSIITSAHSPGGERAAAAVNKWTALPARGFDSAEWKVYQE